MVHDPARRAALAVTAAFLLVPSVCAQADARVLPPDTRAVKAPERPVAGEPIDVPFVPRAVFEVPEPLTPAVPVGPANGLPLPATPPSRAAAAQQPGPGPAGTGVFTFFRNSVVRPGGASYSPASISPSATEFRDVAFQTGNWYAGVSIDGGQTWSYVNPNMFPALDAGFCCNQRVVHVPSRDITVWLLQYAYSPTTQNGSFRIAVTNGRDGLRDAATLASWQRYAFDPQDFGFGPGNWLDFPDVAYNADWLYVSANVFAGNGNAYVGTVRWRLSLDDLQAGGNLSMSYATDATLGAGASLRFAAGANSAQMFWADTINSTTIRIWRQDAAGANTSVDRAVAVWQTTTASCPGPDSLDWMGRAVGRIRGACGTANELIFLWTSDGNGGSRPLPYTRIARFTTALRTLIGDYDLWSPNECWGYAAAAANTLGDIGITVALGGRNMTVHTRATIVDQYEPWNGIHLWDSMGSSTDGPAANRWGDWFDVQRSWLDGRTFVGTGFALYGGNGAANAQPHFSWFGRNDYEPAWVDLTVTSTPVSGVPISVDVTDRHNLKDGVTGFTRSYAPRQGYVLTAPSAHFSAGQLYLFDRWVRNGNNQPIDQTVLTVADMRATADTVEARYKARRTVTVDSTNPATGVAIIVSPPDLANATNGTTVFSRHYKDGTQVTLTAPATVGASPFKRWRQGSLLLPLGQAAVTITLSSNETMTAMYYQHTAGTFTPFGSGCAGRNGVDQHDGNGIPELGQTINYRLGGGAQNSAAILVMGFSNTSWGGVPLPLPVPGSPGCSLFVSFDVPLTTTTDAQGRAFSPTAIPDDVTLIGGHLFTQYWCLDPGAPNSLTFSNGLDTLVGGNR